MFVKSIRAGDDIDVLLGMHPDALGEAAVYNPKLPANLADFSPATRKQLRKRAADMSAGCREWFKPKSTIGKAQRKCGAEFTSMLSNGAQVTKIEFGVKGVRRGKTIMVQFKELTVDGAKIPRAGQKPRWRRQEERAPHGAPAR